MIYRIICLCFGLICCTSLVANAQDFKEILQQKEPLDRFNFIISYNKLHLSEPNLIRNFKTFLEEEGTKDDLDYFDFYATHARYFSRTVPFNKMINELDSSLKKFSAKQNPFLKGVILHYKAQVYISFKHHEEAIVSNLLALNEFSKDEKKEYFKNSYYFHTAGLIFFQYKDFKKALEFGLISHQSKYHNDPNKKFKWLEKANANLIGESYRKLQIFDSALYWHQKCLNLCTATNANDTIWRGIAKSSLAGVYRDLGKTEEALNLYLQSDNINKLQEIYLTDHNTNMYSNMANIYISQKQLSNAKLYLNKALANLQKNESNTSFLNYYKTLLLFNKTSNARATTILQNVDSVNKYQALVDEDFDAKKKIQLEANLIFEKQQQEIKQKVEQFKIARFQNITLFITLVLLILIGILYTKRKRLFYKLQQDKLSHEKEIVTQSLTFAQKQLTDFTQKIHEKNELIVKFEIEIDALLLQTDNQVSEKEKVLESLKQTIILTNEDWDSYKLLFDKVYPHFGNNLKAKYPTITPAELRYLMFSKLQLSNKEMSASLGISLEGVRNLKFRVKQKLKEDFEEFIE